MASARPRCPPSSLGGPQAWRVEIQVSVQYSTVQYSTVQYSTVQYSTVQYSIVQYLLAPVLAPRSSGLEGGDTGLCISASLEEKHIRKDNL